MEARCGGWARRTRSSPGHPERVVGPRGEAERPGVPPRLPGDALRAGAQAERGRRAPRFPREAAAQSAAPRGQGFCRLAHTAPQNPACALFSRQVVDRRRSMWPACPLNVFFKHAQASTATDRRLAGPRPPAIARSEQFGGRGRVDSLPVELVSAGRPGRCPKGLRVFASSRRRVPAWAWLPCAVSGRWQPGGSSR